MGMSHYSVEDIGLVQTLPNLVTMSPMDPVEAKAAACFALDGTQPLYVRLAKRGEPSFSGNNLFDITAPNIVRAGIGTAIVFHGSIANEVMAAADQLLAKGLEPLIVSVPTVQPLDDASLLRILSSVDHVICVEEHFVNCGLGSMLARLKSEHAVRWELKLMGIPPHFIHKIENTEGLRATFGISAHDIVNAVVSASERHGSNSCVP
jgi:transketolase